MMVMRKVVPGMFNKGKEAARPAPRAGASAGSQSVAPASPVKIMGPIKARSAVGWKRPQPEGQPPPAAPAAPAAAPKVEVPPPKEPSPALVPTSALIADEPPPEPPQTTRQPSPPPVLPVSETASVPSGLPAAIDVPAPPAASAPPDPAPAPTPASQTHRRSTRSKRSAAQSTDVFGSVLPTASSRPLQARRRGPLPSETAGPFAGMSALALKTLTSANTARNQQQVARIETEVVRKEGARPDSPTTRVRSAIEKQKEERVQQRQERAERRARRSAGSDLEAKVQDGDGDGDGGSASNEEQAQDAEGEESTMSADQDADGRLGEPAKHRRGPGDEEDYETPPRPERPTKRGRFDEGVEDAGKERGAEVPEKRVKWDRGLHTTVYLEDTPPKPKWTKAVPSQKSCLAAAAKVWILHERFSVDADRCVGSSAGHAWECAERRAARWRSGQGAHCREEVCL